MTACLGRLDHQLYAVSTRRHCTPGVVTPELPNLFMSFLRLRRTGVRRMNVPKIALDTELLRSGRLRS